MLASTAFSQIRSCYSRLSRRTRGHDFSPLAATREPVAVPLHIAPMTQNLLEIRIRRKLTKRQGEQAKVA